MPNNYRFIDSPILKYLIVGFTIAYFILLIIKGYPLPARDDLLFIGAPINSALYDSYTNPFCSGFLEQFGSTQPYFYVPLFGKILELWLFVFGVSTISLLIFIWLIIISGVIGSYLFTRSLFHFDFLSAVAISIFFLLLSLPMGFRPDAMGLSLVFWGSLFIRKAHNRFQQFLGLLLYGLGAITAPLSIGLSIPMFIYLIITKRLMSYKLFITLIGSFFVTAFIFLALIDFNFNPYFKVFFKHLDYVREMRPHLLQATSELIFAGNNIFMRLPFFVLAILGTSIYFIFRNKFNGSNVSLLILLFALIISYLMYPEKTFIFYGIFISWIILVILLNTLKNKMLHMISAGLLLILFIFNHHGILIGSMLQNTSTKHVSSHQNNNLILCGDAVAARVIWHYKLPQNFKSLDFYKTNFTPDSFTEQLSDEIWYYGPGFYYNMLGHDADYDKISILCKTFHAIPKYPLKIKISKVGT